MTVWEIDTLASLLIPITFTIESNTIYRNFSQKWCKKNHIKSTSVLHGLVLTSKVRTLEKLVAIIVTWFFFSLFRKVSKKCQFQTLSETPFKSRENSCVIWKKKKFILKNNSNKAVILLWNACSSKSASWHWMPQNYGWVNKRWLAQCVVLRNVSDCCSRWSELS